MGTKVSDLAALTQGGLETGKDKIYVVDDSAGTSGGKYILVSELIQHPTGGDVTGGISGVLTIGADKVDDTNIADNAIGNEHLQALAVDTAELAADAVEASKIADDAVDTEHIANQAIETAQLAPDAVNSNKLADDAVGSEHIEALAVDSPHIAARAVSSAKAQAVSAQNRVLGRISSGAGSYEELDGDDIATILGTRYDEKVFTVALTDETSNAYVGTSIMTFRSPYALTITEVRASANTAPTGATLIIDILESGTSILGTKLSIDATEKTSETAAAAAVISAAGIVDDAELRFDITQVGSTLPGAGIKVTIKGNAV
jgi:hypothetical protein